MNFVRGFFFSFAENHWCKPVDEGKENPSEALAKEGCFDFRLWKNFTWAMELHFSASYNLNMPGSENSALPGGKYNS
jgi:hypothetical protein